MVDWVLVRHCTGRYTIGYAVPTVVIVFLLAVWLDSLFLLVGPIILGLLLTLFILSGSGGVKKGTAMANADSPGVAGTVTEQTDEDALSNTTASDVKVLFYSIGLLVFGLFGLGVIASIGFASIIEIL